MKSVKILFCRIRMEWLRLCVELACPTYYIYVWLHVLHTLFFLLSCLDCVASFRSPTTYSFLFPRSLLFDPLQSLRTGLVYMYVCMYVDHAMHEGGNPPPPCVCVCVFVCVCVWVCRWLRQAHRTRYRKLTWAGPVCRTLCVCVCVCVCVCIHIWSCAQSGYIHPCLCHIEP